MELYETSEKMCSKNYKDRMQAEYQQLKIRYEKLRVYCRRIEAAELTGEDGPEHDCPLALLKKQLRIMGQYLHVLEVRCEIEDVEL